MKHLAGLALGQPGNAADFRQVLVGAREVEKQVADRLQTKALEQLQARGRDAGGLVVQHRSRAGEARAGRARRQGSHSR